MDVNKSPWSAYGRRQPRPDAEPFPGRHDPTFGAAREVRLSQEQLRKYLDRTLHEFNEIRAGRTGYQRIITEAMKRPNHPESIEETLRRLSGAYRQPPRDRSDPSSTV